jgi:hypothetical protein
MPSAFENIRIMIAPLHGRAPIARITPGEFSSRPASGLHPRRDGRSHSVHRADGGLMAEIVILRDAGFSA